MKRSLFALATALLVLAVPAMAQEPTLEQVLESYYEAIGGLDAWAGVRTARMVGTMTLPGGVEAPVTLLVKRPRKFRFELTFEGMTGVQAVNGDDAWQIMPFMGKPDPEAMPEDQAKLSKEQADFDGPLVNWKEDGNKVEYEGVVDMEGTRTHRLEVTLPNGELRYYHLDAEHYLPLKVEARTTIQGQEMEIDILYGDYKEVGGLMLAHSVEQKPRTQPEGQVITINTVEINVEVADESFIMPGAGG